MNSGDNPFLHLAENHPRVALIGMSGLGKSHWSRFFEERGFTRLSCDEMIAAKLSGGDPSFHLGTWMRFPFDDGYAEREKAYLDLEIETLGAALATLSAAPQDQRFVIDTTGSAPYAGHELMTSLASAVRVVHLATDPAALDRMRENYRKRPRPILWGGRFDVRPGETGEDALSRCYPDLVRFREALYAKYAHQTIPFDCHRLENCGLTGRPL